MLIDTAAFSLSPRGAGPGRRQLPRGDALDKGSRAVGVGTDGDDADRWPVSGPGMAAPSAPIAGYAS